MTELCPLFDPKVDDLHSDAVLNEGLLNESDYDPEWLLRSPPLLDSSAEFLSDVAFPNDLDIKNEIGDVKVEIDDLKDFSDISLRDLTDNGSTGEDFVMPPMDIKQSDSPCNEDGDDEDDDDSSTSDNSGVKLNFNQTTGLVTPPDEDKESFGYAVSRGSAVSSSSSSSSISRPALAVRPLARHATVSTNGTSVTTVDAATTGGARSTGIRYLVQRQGNPTVYLQANANGRLRQVVPRLKRQESKTNDLACTDHYYDNAGSSEDMNGYMVYPPSPPGSSSPDNDHSMVSAAAAAGIYPGHHTYSYSSHLHRSGSNHPSPMFQSPIPQSGVLILTEEEKRTLIAEGYSIPTRLPLTKQEERNLKKIRRKIKNKISAQESRRKKKEYVETLEKKVEVYSHENSELKRRVETLESNNRSLINQLRQLQHIVGKAGSSTPSTCLMVFVLFFAAFLAGPALFTSDLHQMGYASSLPRLPGPPLMPVRAASRGLARFYSVDKLSAARLRQHAALAGTGGESSRLLVDSQPTRGPKVKSEDCSFTGRFWCLFGAPCCTPDEVVAEEDEDPVLVVGNATNSGSGKPMFSVLITHGPHYVNATTL